LDIKLICDLCKTTDLLLIYEPVGSRRNLKVFICESCGLVQSFPKVDHVDERNVAVSGGADWGNIRYGKAFRTNHDLTLLDDVLNISELNNCLDVGSNRGNFINGLYKLNPSIEIWGVEPDKNIMSQNQKNKKLKLINDRVENVELPEGFFDLIYCAHTLEHLKSPRDTLNQLNLTLKEGGHIYIEVPNIEFIEAVDVIEEWFIDKHLYHFSKNVLIQFFENAGFEIIYSSDNSERENISIIGKKTKLNPSRPVSDLTNNKRLVSKYDKTMHSNKNRVIELGNYLNKLASTNKLVIWGAGRIFDNIVKIGGLDTSKVYGLIDKYLPEFISETNGLTIHKPIDLSALNPDFIFICSREYYSEIKKEILKVNKKVKLIGFSQKFNEA
jgi:2-polyprenyl-3-methyl-5-hydroxy-6-metoxy-1,4-benzoquinol methylase